jgi:hypothetical protein
VIGRLSAQHPAVDFGNFLAEIERQNRGVFCPLEELATELENSIETWKASAPSFRWTADTELRARILAGLREPFREPSVNAA